VGASETALTVALAGGAGATSFSARDVASGAVVVSPAQAAP